MQKLQINHLLPPIFGHALHWIRSAFRTSYRISGIKVHVPRRLGLPNIQRKHPLYDRFLPVLCRHLSGSNLIIDVGANIGDTAVAIGTECSNPILCIEPSAIFYPYLLENIRHIPNAQRVSTRQAMIGTGAFTGTLDHSVKGTARLASGAGETPLQFVTLDSLAESLEPPALVKSDTDGFDFDVMLSAKGLIQQHQPVLFWENEIHGSTQLEGFATFYRMLMESGYEHLYVFDNFGNLLLEQATVQSLLNLNDYLNSMENFNQTRTFHYLDILASTQKHIVNVRSAIEEYKIQIHKQPSQ